MMMKTKQNDDVADLISRAIQECRDYATAVDEPLPGNASALDYLASIGVPGAANKLSKMRLHNVGGVMPPNDKSSATTPSKPQQ